MPNTRRSHRKGHRRSHRRRTYRSQRGAARFFHYSNKPIQTLRNLPDKNVGRPVIKPAGLWFAEDEAWRNWCSNADYCNVAGDHKYEATIDTSKLYVVDSLESLKSLQKAYPSRQGFGLDWVKLAKDYPGIYFANYGAVKADLMKSRKDFNPAMMWFLGVDIASICIWRPSEAITHFEEIENA